MNYIIETERFKLRELTLDDTEKLELVLSDPQFQEEDQSEVPHSSARETRLFPLRVKAQE